MKMILERFQKYCETLPQNANPQAQLRLSASGDCPRLLDYLQQRGPKPIGFQQFVRMELGHAVHHHFQIILKDFLDEDLIGVEEEVSLEGFPGHPDGRIVSLKATLEIKSVSDATYKMILAQGKPLEQHIDQANAYAYALKDEWILILYINRDKGTCQEFMFETSKELGEKVIDKFNTSKHNKIAGTLTPRPYNDATESPCWFCPFVSECYEGFEKEVASGSDAVIEDPEMIGLARQAIVFRSSRLIAEKSEGMAKTLLANKLIGLKVKVASFTDSLGAMLAEVKVGKNNNPLINVKEVKNG